MLRTHNCGELRISDIGKRVKLTGWLDTVRDLGAMLFLTLRDFYGVVQIIISDDDLKELVREIQRESTVLIEGVVVKRLSANEGLLTGQIEVCPDSVEVLGRCSEPLPFQILSSDESREDTRLRYRFLDLRNPKNKCKIIKRSKVIHFLRNKMISRGFYEIQTPILTSSSPEGARDYLVPSRVHPGKFYALPQAPQQFKQLLMISGFDKYFQVAPCFRDEDSRADRSPGEFYQLDIEMAFVEQEDVFELLEDVMAELFEHFTGCSVRRPFLRIRYDEALSKYGTDKPDLRNPLIIFDVSFLFKDADIPFFKGKVLKAIYLRNFKKSRKFIEEMSNKMRENGGQGLAWLKLGVEGFSGSIVKYITEDMKKTIIKEIDMESDSAVVIVYDDAGVVEKLAGILRVELWKGLNLDSQIKKAYKFCWIVDFPMYEIDDKGKIDFSHNPFSMPQGKIESQLHDPLSIVAYQYDLVCNGVELSSGAVRNHDPEVMLKVFEIAGYSEKDVQSNFPALFNALKYGAPPHAGIAPGIERILMLLFDEPNIREVTAFPMNKNAQDLMMGAPSEVTKQQLDDLKVKPSEQFT